jgi:hypothetical protein
MACLAADQYVIADLERLLRTEVTGGDDLIAAAELIAIADDKMAEGVRSPGFTPLGVGEISGGGGNRSQRVPRQVPPLHPAPEARAGTGFSLAVSDRASR